MESRHNTTQDQPIVNVTDDTSNALLRMRTLAPPVCAAADSPTANSGRGMMNARRSIRGSWCGMAILVAFAVMLAVCIAPALASAGNAPNITSWSNDKTNDQSLDITVNISENVNFNATANQSDITWNWYDDGANQSHNYDNITLSWSSSGLKTLIVNATNTTNGTSDPVQWNVTVNPVTWWNSSWNYYKQLTIDHNYVNGSQTDFPMMINITDTELALKAQQDGDDIVFVNSDNTIQLDHQIEGTFNSTTGHLKAWIRIPTLSNTTDTVINMYYNNSGAINTENPGGVWGVNASGIWLMDEGTGDDVNDSSGNGNHGVNHGADWVAGGLDFNGTSDYVNGSISGPTNCVGTVSFWIYPRTEGEDDQGRIMALMPASGWNALFFDVSGTNRLTVAINDGTNGITRTGTDNDITLNAWNHVVYSYDGSAGGTGIKIYVNGTEVAYSATTGTESMSATPSSFVIGANDIGGNYAFDGLITGTYVYNRALSAAEIGTRYNNTNSPSTFSTVDTEQSQTTPPAPTNLQSTTSNYWVNYTWTVGSGIVTDGYNVSMNNGWYNRTGTSLNSDVGAGNWSNITVWAWNATGDGNMSITNLSGNVQAPAAPVGTTPPAPTNLQSTTSNYWVNYTWQAGTGTGVLTDGYNVSMNNGWHNRTGTSLNSDVGAGNWSNITVWAWNATGDGNMSATNLSGNVQAPAAPVGTTPPAPTNLQSATGNYWVNHTWTVGTGIVTDGYNVSMDGWHNTTETFFNSSVGAGNWSNITVWAWNATGDGNMSITNLSGNVQAPAAPSDTTPPAPTNLQSATGNYWVNHTWTVGTGIVTDGYNVSMDGWHNTTETFFNSSVGAGNWSNITVWAWNATGDGNMSITNLSGNVQAPAAPSDTTPPAPTNLQSATGNYWVNHTWTVGTGIVTDGYNVSMDGWHNTTETFFNSSVGAGNWSNITVWAWNATGDGNMSITNLSGNVQAPAAPSDTTPPAPTNLQSATGNYWVNHTWTVGTGIVTDGYNVSMDGWHNTTETFFNSSVGAGNWSNITVWAWNATGDGNMSITNLSGNVQAPAAPSDTTPPAPTNLQSATGNYWVNHTWTVGTGIVTDGYNVSMDGWHNTTETFFNSSVGAGNWSNITVWAWNATGDGNMSITNLSGNVQAPAAPSDTTPPAPTNLQSATGNYWVNHTWTVGTGIVTDGYNVSMDGWHNTTETFFNSSVGAGNWSNITVWAWNATGDGNMSITNLSGNVQAPAAPSDTTPPAPTNLQSATGNYWVNHTWTVGTGIVTDGYNVSMDGWHNTTETFFNSSVGAGNWSNITVWAWNATGDGNMSITNLSGNVQAPAAPSDTTPPAPTNLQSATGNYWVNHTWTVGTGIVTDGYNVSMDGWHNTTETFFNSSVGAGNWSNITVWAWNATGDGNMSITNLSGNVQAPSTYPMIGDINGDGVTGLTGALQDAIYLLKYSYGDPVYSEIYDHPDCNGNGVIGSTGALQDAIYLLKHAYGDPAYSDLYPGL